MKAKRATSTKSAESSKIGGGLNYGMIWDLNISPWP